MTLPAPFEAVPIGVAALVAWMTVASAVAFLAHGRDKRAAIKGRRRTPEARLHLYELLGGWPGALIAQDRLRHLTKNDRFRRFFWLATTFNVLTACWFLTPDGRFWSEAIPLLLQRLFRA